MNTYSSDTQNKIIVMKRRSGLFYGMVGGLAFAITLWGVDGYRLYQAHAYFPWIKLLVGSLLTTAVGGLAGWLVARLENALLAILIWFASAGAFAWLSMVVPVVFAPKLMGLLEPELKPLLYYTVYDNLPSLVGVAFAWIAIAVFIISVIEIPMVEQAVFSQSIFGKIAPHIVCALLMLISGAVVDNLQNQPMRDPVISMNTTIQFSINTRDKDVTDSKMARELHLASLRPVQDLITEERRLIVSRYDPLFENVYVLINFDGNWVECGTIFSHPLMCEAITP